MSDWRWEAEAYFRRAQRCSTPAAQSVASSINSHNEAGPSPGRSFVSGPAINTSAHLQFNPSGSAPVQLSTSTILHVSAQRKLLQLISHVGNARRQLFELERYILMKNNIVIFPSARKMNSCLISPLYIVARTARLQVTVRIFRKFANTDKEHAGIVSVCKYYFMVLCKNPARTTSNFYAFFL